MRIEHAVDNMSPMRTVPGHIRHAVEMHLWELLDVVPFAVIIVDGDQRVVGMNVRGQTMLREAEAIRFDGARVRAADVAVNSRIEAAIRVEKKTFIRVPRVAGKRAAEMSVLPLCHDCCAIVISDPAQRLMPDEKRLRELYGLTPAEVRVLVSVVQGEGAQCAARELNMSVNTVRRHLKSIFSKVQVERQSELVRVVSSGIAALNLDAIDPNG